MKIKNYFFLLFIIIYQSLTFGDALAGQASQSFESSRIWGGIALASSLEIKEEYNDNVFVTDTNTVSDWVTHIAPSLTWQNMSKNHPVTITAGAETHLYADQSEENTTDAFVKARGTLTIKRHHKIHVLLAHDYNHEERSSESSLINLKDPIAYNLTTARLGTTHLLGRFTLQPSITVQNWNWDNNETRSGTTIVQDDRDRVEAKAAVKLSYSVWENTDLFTKIVAHHTDYKRDSYDSGARTYTGRNRDSQALESLLGVDYQLTGKTKMSVAGGYWEQDFEESGQKNISTFSSHASLDWDVNGLTSITAAYDRSVEETTQATSAYIKDAFSLRVDHALKRNINLFAHLGVGVHDYVSSDRKANTIETGAGVAYEWRPGITATAQYLFDCRNSDNISSSYLNDYDRNRFLLGMAFKF